MLAHQSKINVPAIQHLVKDKKQWYKLCICVLYIKGASTGR